MLQWKLATLLLFLVLTAQGDILENSCDPQLQELNINSSKNHLALSFIARRSLLKEALSSLGTGYMIVPNPNWNQQFGDELYNQVPLSTNMHVDTTWFSLKNEVISNAEVVMAFASDEKIEKDFVKFSKPFLKSVQAIADVIRDQMNAALPEDEKVKIDAIGLLSHHHNSQDLHKNENFYVVHQDNRDGDMHKSDCYLRAVITLYGPGTYYWLRYPGDREQLKAGDVLIFEGEARQNERGISREMLWHQIPDMTATRLGRLTLRIDFVKKNEKPVVFLKKWFSK